MQSLCRLLRYLAMSLDFSHRSFFFPCARDSIRLVQKTSEMESCPHSALMLWLRHEVIFVPQQFLMCVCVCELTFLVFASPGRWGKIPPSAKTLQPQFQQLPGRLRPLHPVPLTPELQSTRYQPQRGATHCLYQNRLSCKNLWPCKRNLWQDLQIISGLTFTFC